MILESREGRKRQRERNIDAGEKHWLLFVRISTRDLTHNPDTYPDWESNLRPFVTG